MSSVAWHAKGDYIVSVAPSATPEARRVSVHQLSKRKSLAAGCRGAVTCARFHPTKPFLFVSTQTRAHLPPAATAAREEAALGLQADRQSGRAPVGDHVLVASYDRRLAWFDLDAGASPYKTLKYHTKALRAVACHARYPLVASCSDDGTTHVFHATVYDDLLRQPLIVPVKVLRGHEVRDGVGVLAIAFAPTRRGSSRVAPTARSSSSTSSDRHRAADQLTSYGAASAPMLDAGMVPNPPRLGFRP